MRPLQVIRSWLAAWMGIPELQQLLVAPIFRHMAYGRKRPLRRIGYLCYIVKRKENVRTPRKDMAGAARIRWGLEMEELCKEGGDGNPNSLACVRKDSQRMRDVLHRCHCSHCNTTCPSYRSGLAEYVAILTFGSNPRHGGKI